MFRTLDHFPNGDKPKYTFFTDFDIAAMYGEDGIADTYYRVKKEWGDNYEAMTEVSICLNLLCWDYYGRNDEISNLFADYYYASKDYFYDHFEDNKDALDYYFRMTD